MKQLKDYTDLELKALKSDTHDQLALQQNNMQLIVGELNRRANLPKEETKNKK
jgi:hypothetical protein